MLITDERLGHKPQKILHLGAYLCEEAPIYKRLGATEVMWVEADPHMFYQAQAVCNSYPGHTILNCAIYDEDGLEKEFFICNNRGCSSLKKLYKHKNHYPHIQETHSITVRTRTVDSICAEYNFQPDMLNLDLQGGELNALRGSTKTLQNVQLVYSEVSFEELYLGAPLIQDIDNCLAEFGFERTALADTGFQWGDAVYKKRTTQ